MEVFRQLPSAVQRQARDLCPRRALGVAHSPSEPQVWELDNALFIRHVTPSVLAYAEETATLLRELDMVRPRARFSMELQSSDALAGRRAASWLRSPGWKAQLARRPLAPASLVAPPRDRCLR